VVSGSCGPALRDVPPEAAHAMTIDFESLGRAVLQATTEKMHARVVENSEIRATADRAAW
jgi:hypothetical protein